MSQVILNLIATYSLMYGVDPILATAVVAHESKFDTKAVGPVGELGLMQLRPEYFAASCKDNKSAPGCGRELFNPETNIAIGIRHLADLKNRCKHKDQNSFIVCHNVGVVGGSRLQKPKEFAYYKKVMAEYERLEKMNLFAKAKTPSQFDIASMNFEL